MYRVLVINFKQVDDVRVHEAQTVSALVKMIQDNYDTRFLNVEDLVTTPGKVSYILLRSEDDAMYRYPSAGDQDYRVISLPRLPVTDAELAACRRMSSLSLAPTLSAGRRSRSRSRRSKSRRNRK
jgi:hypothetical protein